MGRKVQGQLTIDGIDVDYSQARFADTFDVADVDTPLLASDEEVVYVVVAHVSVPSFREGKNGEVKRVNVLKVREARLITDEAYKVKVLDAVGFDYRPQPSMLEQPESKSEEPIITPADADTWGDGEELADVEILDGGIQEATMVDQDEVEVVPIEDPSDRAEYLARVQHARDVANAEDEVEEDGVALLRRPRTEEPRTGPHDVRPGDHVGGAAQNDETLRKFLEAS